MATQNVFYFNRDVENCSLISMPQALQILTPIGKKIYKELLKTKSSAFYWDAEFNIFIMQLRRLEDMVCDYINGVL